MTIYKFEIIMCSIKNKIIRGGANIMVELEESCKILSELEPKIKNLGDSL